MSHNIRKICNHPRRQWAKCECPWHFAFKWKGTHHRFSLDKFLDKRIDSKSAAVDAAADIRKAIKAGTFGHVAPRGAMTLRQLADTYLERYVDVEHAATKSAYVGSLNVICRTAVPSPGGGSAPLGDWRLTDIVTDTVERFREVRRGAGAGVPTVNRNLAMIRALFGWAVRVGYLEATPFKRQTETVIKLSKELPRSRRLDSEEADHLVAACAPHLRALVEAALESGCRRGELLSLQWSQIEGMQVSDDATVTWAPKARLVLLAGKTKTKTERRVPISTRLRAILELRRLDPVGKPHVSDAFVFGSEIGTRVQGFKRAWARAVLKAHGVKPGYTETGQFDVASRKALAKINLHFHDLRRECGSRWMDGGVPLATIQRWLGHHNVSQTSTYLSGTPASEDDAMARFEGRLQQLATRSKTGGRKRPQSATTTDRRPNKSAVGGKPATM